MAKKPSLKVVKETTTARRNGKAPKKNPKKGNENATGKTSGGYTPAKIAARALKRGQVA